MRWARRFPPDSGILSDAIGYMNGELTTIIIKFNFLKQTKFVGFYAEVQHSIVFVKRINLPGKSLGRFLFSGNTCLKLNNDYNNFSYVLLSYWGKLSRKLKTKPASYTAFIIVQFAPIFAVFFHIGFQFVGRANCRANKNNNASEAITCTSGCDVSFLNRNEADNFP